LAASPLASKTVLLIISGGIAAFKALELVRLLRHRQCGVTCVLTDNGGRFITPLSLQALSESKIYSDLFSLTDESEMGHIQLSRSADLLVVAPATANILAKMAGGLADDLASTVLLATDKPVLVAPAMNVRMWLHPATQANVASLLRRGVRMIGPDEGAMACHEFGPGRFAEPQVILHAIEAMLLSSPTPAASQGTAFPQARPQQAISQAIEFQGGEFERTTSPVSLAGRHALVTSGPTHEPIDPVRYIANRSSGRQGHAIAAALRDLGARVTLISGPVSLPDPSGVTVRHVESAREMLDACRSALPADVAVFAAAVADWRVDNASAGKLKKRAGAEPPALRLVPNPDILASIAAAGPTRPPLVIGFAAETDDLIRNAQAKLARKNADWIVANDVSPASGIMGGEENTVHIVSSTGVEDWPRLAKRDVARRLARRIQQALS